MLKVGVTGGIGSGKSTVCQVFEALGIPVLYADEAARYLMQNDAALINGIKLLLGDDAYESGRLNHKRVGEIVFNKPDLLEKLNGLVHPAVIRYGQMWMDSRQSPYVLKQAALFFESGSDKYMDVMIGVFAPQKTRIKRVMKRDNVSQNAVLQRMGQQMDEDEKMRLCDYVIDNDDDVAVLPQVLKLHQTLLAKAGK